MIKQVWLLARKEGVSVEQFQTHWREKHSQVVLAAPGIRAYVQSYVIPEAYDFYDVPWDGMAQIWFDDLKAMAEAEASEPWQTSGSDARQFVGSGARLVTTEFPLLNNHPSPRHRHSLVKCVCLPNRNPGLSVADYQRHWRERHGPLVIAAFPQMVHYVQSHVVPQTYESSRPPTYDGVAELWFLSLDDFPWGLVQRGDEPVPEPTSTNPAAVDARSLFRLPTPGIPMREVSFRELNDGEPA